ncbi:MAG: hypothetical protein IJ344_00870, partial [Clostridia bacterium]|nr:hypothetical protein [Clostridia bacterium]
MRIAKNTKDTKNNTAAATPIAIKRPPFSSFSVFIIARPLVVVNKHFVEALGQERRSFSLNRAKTLTSGH